MNRENEGVDWLRKQELFQGGADYYKSKRYQETLDRYEEVLKLDANDVVAYVGKEIAYISRDIMSKP